MTGKSQGFETRERELAEKLSDIDTQFGIAHEGGSGSGNFGHQGRPGSIGGSAPEHIGHAKGTLQGHPSGSLQDLKAKAKATIDEIERRGHYISSNVEKHVFNALAGKYGDVTFSKASTGRGETWHHIIKGDRHLIGEAYLGGGIRLRSTGPNGKVIGTYTNYNDYLDAIFKELGE